MRCDPYQTRTVLSSLPDTAWQPEGEQATLRTQLVWPLRVNKKLKAGYAHTCHRHVLSGMLGACLMSSAVAKPASASLACL